MFARFQADPEFSISKTLLSAESYDSLISAHVEVYDGQRDVDRLVLLRCVFMNPFWADEGVQAELLPKFISRLGMHLADVTSDAPLG